MLLFWGFHTSWPFENTISTDKTNLNQLSEIIDKENLQNTKQSQTTKNLEEGKFTTKDSNKSKDNKEICNGCQQEFTFLFSHISQSEKCQCFYNMDILRKEKEDNRKR